MRYTIISVVVALVALALSPLSVSAQVGTYSGNDVYILPAPTISLEDAAALEQIGQEYLAKRELRTATAPVPNCSISSLRTIYPNNEQVVQKICYGEIDLNKQIQKMTLAELAARYAASEKQSRAVTSDLATAE
jgi:hypothetical protein